MTEENEQQTQQDTAEPVTVAARERSKVPIVIIIVLIVVAAVGAGGLFLLKDSIFPTKGVNGQVLSANCKLNDKDLCKFMNNIKGLENMSAKTTATINGKKTESTMEIQGADKSHITSSVDGKEESNYIAIGKTTYMKDYKDGKWLKTTSSDTSADTKSDWKSEFEKSINDSENKTTYKKIGKESCGKLTCLKYQIVNPQQDANAVEYIWFDTKEYLMRKSTTTSGGATTETTFSYDKINITEPSPVKEISQEDASKAILENAATGGTLTPAQIDEINKQYGGSLNGTPSLPVGP